MRRCTPWRMEDGHGAARGYGTLGHMENTHRCMVAVQRGGTGAVPHLHNSPGARCCVRSWMKLHFRTSNPGCRSALYGTAKSR